MVGSRTLWQRWKRTSNAIRNSNLYDTRTLKKNKCKNDGYGELLPAFTNQLIDVLNIKEGAVVADIGSGMGLFALDLAALTNCSVVGIEVRGDLYQRAMEVLDQAKLVGLNVDFILGDATQDDSVISFHKFDVVVCCNTLWSSDTNYRLLQKLAIEMKEDAKLVVLEQMSMHRLHGSSSTRRKTDILAQSFDLPPLKLDCLPGCVSWTASGLPFYIYNKKVVPGDVVSLIIEERKRIELFTKKENEKKQLRSERGIKSNMKRKTMVEPESKQEPEPEPELKKAKVSLSAQLPVPRKKREPNYYFADDLGIKNGCFVSIYPNKTEDQTSIFWLARVTYIYASKHSIRVSWFEKEPNCNNQYYETISDDKISLSTIILGDITLNIKDKASGLWLLPKKQEKLILEEMVKNGDVSSNPRSQRRKTRSNLFENFVPF